MLLPPVESLAHRLKVLARTPGATIVLRTEKLLIIVAEDDAAFEAVTRRFNTALGLLRVTPVETIHSVPRQVTVRLP